MGKNNFLFRRVHVVLAFFLLAMASGCSGDPVLHNAELLELKNWEFVPNHFVNASNDQGIEWRGVVMPDKWPGTTMESFGYGTYRTLIDLEEGHTLGVQVANVLSSYNLFLEDSLIAHAGRPAETQEREIAKIDRCVNRIPNHQASGQYYLYLQVSNFQYHVGGVLRPIKVADYKPLLNWRSKQLIVEAVQCGALGLIAIFLFTYFSFRQKEAYIFFFGLLSVGIMFRLMLSGQMIGMVFFPEIGGEILLKIILITFYMGISLHYVVLAGIFEEEIPDWSRQFVFVAGILMSLFLIITPLHIGSFSTPFFQLFAIVSGAFLLFCLFRAAIKHRTGAKTVLVGGIITFGFLINDILYNMQFVNTGNFMGWAVIIYISLIVVVISRRFSSAMDNEEGLLNKLANINRNLEQRVRERTQMIERYRANVEAEARMAKEQNRRLKRIQEEEHAIKHVMVHDLRAPFNKILGLAKILRMNSNFNSKEENEISEMIEKVAEDGRHLIDDLNVLNLYESHIQDKESYQDTDLHQLLEGCVKSHVAYAQSKNIQLGYHGHHKVSSYINPKMLVRIVDNLLSNAIKFSDEGTEVNVRLIRKNGMYEIVIQDQGPGFSDEDLRKVFKKFQKLSARPTKGESSTGLGLNIVKNLTELMGGKVNLHTRQGEGSEFILEFYITARELYLN